MKSQTISTEKYQGFGPLPGGVETFVDTLQKSLAFIRDSRPSEEQLAAWFAANFEGIAVGGSTRWAIRVTLWHSGLVVHDKKGHYLSKQGKQYLDQPTSNTLLFQILDEHVLGFRETLEIIAGTEVDMSELAKELSRRTKMSWETPTQPYWRIGWLRSMKFVAMEGGKFKLTNEGRDLFKTVMKPSLLQPTENANEQITNQEREQTLSETRPVAGVIDRLRNTQHLTAEFSRFEMAIGEAFNFLGFSTDQLGRPGDTDVFAAARLGEESYSIVIDGKTTERDRIIERQISWPTLRDHKKHRHADFVAVIAPAFSGGDLTERAIEYDVALIDTDTLVKLLEIHDRTPLNLEDLRKVFEKRVL